MTAVLSHLVFWHWLALALVLGIIDVLVGANFLFVWCGLAAALVGMLLFIFPVMTWEFQFLIFGLGVLASLIIWQRYLKRVPHTSDTPHLNRRSQQYIGRVFTLEEPIINGRGKARVEDTLWQVKGPDLPVGTQVRVIDVDGVILKIEKI
jgi:hypothetical protein